MSRIGVVGRGEVGGILLADLAALGHEVAAYDVRDDASGPPLAAVVEGADLVVSAVTPGRCVDAARSVAAVGLDGAWFLDLNSASPDHKRDARALVDEAGGRYVEAALMSAIAPRRLGSPFLLGGDDAAAFAEAAPAYGLSDVTVVDGPLGTAAATKLCRSVLVKGLEALFTESLLAARSHGVERAVLDSLSNMLPGDDWERMAGYFLERSLRHGTRRGEEMDEAAHTVAEAGIDPWMSRAAAERQRWAGAFALTPPDPTTPVTAVLDRMLAHLEDVS